MITIEDVLAVGHKMKCNPTDTAVAWVLSNFHWASNEQTNWEETVEALLHEAITLELDNLYDTV